MKTVLGLFTEGEARSVVEDLVSAGYRREDISLVERAGAELTATLDALGVPAHEAGSWAGGLRHGDVLVAVQADDDRTERAEAIMSRYDPVDVERHPAPGPPAPPAESEGTSYTTDDLRRERDRRAGDRRPRPDDRRTR